MFRGKSEDADEATWFGQLVAFVKTEQEGEGPKEWALVRWFKEAPQTDLTAQLRMTRLQWCTHRRNLGDGPMQTMDYYDLVYTEDIIEPVFIQQDPTADDYFFYNHFVR